MLAILACHFNPCGYARPADNLRQWLASMRLYAHHVQLVEAVFPDQYCATELQGPYKTRIIQATRNNIMWQKERLLQIAIDSLPAAYDNVAWIDTDLLFANPYWYEQTENWLEQYPAVQMCEEFRFTDQDGRIERSAPSLASCWSKARTLPGGFSPGGCVAARREIAERAFYQADILGGGDQALMGAWTGNVEQYNYRTSPAWSTHYRRWATMAGSGVDGLIGCVPGDCIHLWHGDHKNRQYSDRHKILARHNYDPKRHVRVGENGLVEWTESAPLELRESVRHYFARRYEDGKKG